MSRRGTLIAIEGTNGAGKSTQFDLLVAKLKQQRFDVESFRFPQYDQPSSYFVREYLAGKFGSGKDIGPYTASMFYVMDRYEASQKIKLALSKGKIVVTDRYTGSNMAHQGVYFDNTEQRRGFFIWLDQMEFETFQIPRPDISIVLRVPAEVAIKNIDQRGIKKDIHEKSLAHTKRSVEVYDNLCQLFPKDFKEIDCTRGGKLMEKKFIADQVWKTVSAYLPEHNRVKKKTEQT
ncbi:MAG TPA: thymidylate kinase [Patescibacteria group bacterium]|nr:thymidylate kinase [Patescibacteria group bacterium]